MGMAMIHHGDLPRGGKPSGIGKIGRKISRKKALKISMKILKNAEKERKRVGRL